MIRISHLEIAIERKYVMTFIIILIALMLERFFHWHHLRHWHWFSNYEYWLSQRMSALPAILILLVIVVPPLLIIAAFQYLLANWWWGALEFIFSVIVLLYCFGPDNLWVQAYSCINKLAKQEPAAVDHVQTAFNLPATENSQAFHQAFVRAILLASHQRIFAVLFWFVLVGPVGAVLYRIIESISTQEMTGAKLANQIKALLDWLPVRVETFLFALGGHFTPVVACWKRGILKGPSTNDLLLTECGMAALDISANGQLSDSGSAEQETLALIDRAFIIGLVILAMVVLLG
jgi:AmpE protein